MRPAPLPILGLALLFPLSSVLAGPLDRLIPGMKKDAEHARQLAEKEVARLQDCQKTMQDQKKTGGQAATTTVLLRECQNLIEEGKDEYRRKDYSDAQDIFDRARQQARKALLECEDATAVPKARTPSDSASPDVNLEAPTTPAPAAEQSSAIIDVPGMEVEDEEKSEEEEKSQDAGAAEAGDKAAEDEETARVETSASAEKSTTSTTEVTSKLTTNEDAIQLPGSSGSKDDEERASDPDDDEKDPGKDSRGARREKRRIRLAERRRARQEALRHETAAKDEDDDKATGTKDEGDKDEDDEAKDDKSKDDKSKDDKSKDDKAEDDDDSDAPTPRTGSASTTSIDSGTTPPSSVPSKAALRERAEDLNTRVDSLLHQIRAARSQARRARDEADIDPKGAAASLDLAEQILKDIRSSLD